VLFTYANSEAANLRVLGVAAAHGLPTVLDSGAWSVFNAGVKIDPVRHAKFVIDAAALYPHARFLGLDVIYNPEETWRNWNLQRDLGAPVEPTIHMPAGPEVALRYVEAGLATEWMNLGGLAGAQGVTSRVRAATAWAATIRRALPPEIKLHGLGTTTPYANDLMRFDGVDSSYWRVSLARYRTLPLFDPDKRRWARALVASAKPEYVRASKADIHAMSRMLRRYYSTTPALLLEMTDERRLGLSLRSHAYFADAYRHRHASYDTPIVYLAGAPTKADDPIWDEIARWSHNDPRGPVLTPPAEPFAVD